ncbi:MAG TPA: hypothetical protein VHO69_12750 [Phototrophicaceae bacterium]|nr:hypothetical protein [Phototrophicaceae bacterium]
MYHNCRQQLGNVKVASGQVSGDKVVFVALSVETDLTADTLEQYAETNDFDWIFAVATPELLGELVNTFGRAITAPPSTPHFIIRSDGTTTALVTGIETPDQLVQHLQAEAGG